jgi:hypothetical protein
VERTSARSQALAEQLLTVQLFTEQLLTEQLFTEQLFTEQLFTEQLFTEQLFTEQLLTEQPPAEAVSRAAACTTAVCRAAVYRSVKTPACLQKLQVACEAVDVAGRARPDAADGDGARVDLGTARVLDDARHQPGRSAPLRDAHQLGLPVHLVKAAAQMPP